MHEWLEALQKSARTTAPGAAAEELRRSETEFGIPLPGELGDLYSVLNGGTFEGEVVLFPLTAEGEHPSVQEKTRKMLVGLPVAGVWRFGLKGPHRHLFAARKSAMMEQGDGGGPLPEWVQALGDDDWLYGTWDEEQKDMRLYRALSQMLPVLVPPVEHEDFGDRTFARAIAAVEGALSELSGEEEDEAAEEEEAAGEVQDLQYEYEEGQAPEAGDASTSPGLQQPAVMAAERRVKSIKRTPTRKAVVTSEPPAKQTGAGLEKPAVIAAERRVKHLTEQAAPEAKGEESPRKKAAARTAARKRTEQAPAASKAPAKQASAKPSKGGGTAPAAQKSAAKKAPAKKAAPGPSAVKKAAPGKGAAKKGAAKKAPAQKAAAKKGPAQKSAAKKAPAKKAPAQKASAKKAPAKKAPAKKGAVKKAPAQKASAKKAPAKKAPAKKAGARRG
ncbi:histone H1-like repetitive region-containing protein [Stigmatella erecta]|uniref:Histone H1-like nucleoprotein HC2 n=1 Tax=Stigmatella erecta TaxID=83460 RepID=A0A1I0LC03_9BACT|nr:histone H1-like repetitive region-containing protein [Stigmatella erecta]SEU37659.1 Histone H1-like nucleoprotein HC2 [Stigmatella erecta]